MLCIVVVRALALSLSLPLRLSRVCARDAFHGAENLENFVYTSANFSGATVYQNPGASFSAIV